jgi:hypothetical protein
MEKQKKDDVEQKKAACCCGSFVRTCLAFDFSLFDLVVAER